VARIISVGKKSKFKSLLYEFRSLDLFTRLLIVTIVLLIITTPFITYNNQLLNTRAENQVQRLEEIQGLQNSQGNLKKVLTRSPGDNISSNTPNKGFNLIDSIYNIFVSITRIFIK
jgi:hypothetical protein